MVMVVIMVVVDVNTVRGRRSGLRCNQCAQRELGMNSSSRAALDEIDGMVHDLPVKQHVQILPDSLHAARKGDHKRVLDRTSDWSRERRERGLLEGC